MSSPKISRPQRLVGKFSSRMDEVAPIRRGFPPGSSNKGDNDDASKRPTSGVVRASALPRQFVVTTSSSYKLCILFTFAPTFFGVICAQSVANFSVQSTKYDCSASGNMICLGEARVYEGDFGSSGIEPGRLSLADLHTGVAYYNKPVKLRDQSTGQSASFSTTFTMDMRPGSIPKLNATVGDGMTFVLSANKSHIGDAGDHLGFFGGSSYSTTFKSIVVEFDTYQNDYNPVFDISWNHVSFDFGNITAMATAEARVNISDEVTKYVWVDYSSETRQLEVRIDINTVRPVNPLLSYTVNISDFAEDLMWVGFSSSSWSSVSNFYIGDWTFVTHGIPAPSLGSALLPPSLVPMAQSPGQAPPPSSPARMAPSPARLLGIVMGTSVGVFAFLLACVLVFALLVRQKMYGGRFQLWWAAPMEDGQIMPIEGIPELFSYKQLSVATKDFSEASKLGKGAFGTVYRGVLPSSGILVAVKKIHSDSNQGEKEFMAEVSIISQLRHRNLIQLHGWCKDPSQGRYLLVYELMPNRSLDKVLFQPAHTQIACLSWPQRFNVALGTAAALGYLHHGCKQQVLHRDIKSSNIMLDKDWNAKLGDFGLARLVDHQREATTTQPAGTLGYIAPEVFPRGKFTDKSDVFAFGAVVLEVACGRKALAFHVPEEEKVLVDWVWHRLSEDDLMSTVDKRLEEYDSSKMEVMLKVGLLCSHPDPLARPSMLTVVQMLAGDIPVLSIPASKPAPIYCSGPPIVKSASST